jgi:hypothetical protein
MRENSTFDRLTASKLGSTTTPSSPGRVTARAR